MSKKPEGKYEPTLVYSSFIKLIAKRRRYGIEKHGNSEDWRSTSEADHHDAMMRHLLADIDGERDENGDDHLVALACTAMFEIERRYGGTHKTVVRGRRGK